MRAPVGVLLRRCVEDSDDEVISFERNNVISKLFHNRQVRDRAACYIRLLDAASQPNAVPSRIADELNVAPHALEAVSIFLKKMKFYIIFKKRFFYG